MLTVTNSKGVRSSFSTDHLVGSLVSAGVPGPTAINHGQVISGALNASGATNVTTAALKRAVGEVVAHPANPDTAALGALFRSSGSVVTASISQPALRVGAAVGVRRSIAGGAAGSGSGSSGANVPLIAPWRGFPLPSVKQAPDPPPPPRTATDPNLALVLSAGSSKVAFEVGAVRYLYSTYWPGAKQLLPGILIGTSGGSLNAVKLAEGGTRALDGLEGIWLGMNRDWDMFMPQWWYGDLLSLAPQLVDGIAAELLDTGLDDGVTIVRSGLFLAGVATGGVLGVLGAIGGALASFFDILNILNINDQADQVKGDLQLAQSTGSLYTLAPILGMLGKNVYPTWVAASGIKLRLTLTNLGTGATEYMDENAKLSGRVVSDFSYNFYWGSNDSQGGTSSFPPIYGGAVASASIPVVFEPVQLNSAWYVDGGVRAYANIGAAIDLGAKQVICISTQPPSLDSQAPPLPSISPSLGSPGSPWTTSSIAQRCIDIATAQIVADEVSPRNPYSVPVTVIAPTQTIPGGTSIDPGDIRIDMAYGFLRASDVLSLPADHEGWDGPTSRDAVDATDTVLTSRKHAWQRELDSLVYVNAPPPSVSDVLGVLNSGAYWPTYNSLIADWISQAMDTGAALPPFPALPSYLGFTTDEINTTISSWYQGWLDSLYAGARQAVADFRQDKRDVCQAVVTRLATGTALPDPSHWAGKPPDVWQPWDDPTTWWQTWEAHKAPLAVPTFGPWDAVQIPGDPGGPVAVATPPQFTFVVSVTQGDEAVAKTTITVFASDVGTGWGLANTAGTVTDTTSGQTFPLGQAAKYTFPASVPNLVVHIPPYADQVIPASAYGSRYPLVLAAGGPGPAK